MTDEETVPPEPSSSDPPAMPSMPPPPSLGDLGSGSTYPPATSGLSTGPRRSSAATESGIRRQGGILMMAGGLVVLASLPLTELTVKGGSITSSVNGMHGAALWLLVICVFAFMRGYSTIKPTAFRTSIPILSGVFVVWAIYTRWQEIDRITKYYAGAPSVTVSTGIGFWITCLGGALIVVGSVILQFVKPQRG